MNGFCLCYQLPQSLESGGDTKVYIYVCVAQLAHDCALILNLSVCCQCAESHSQTAVFLPEFALSPQGSFMEDATEDQFLTYRYDDQVGHTLCGFLDQCVFSPTGLSLTAVNACCYFIIVLNAVVSISSSFFSWV